MNKNGIEKCNGTPSTNRGVVISSLGNVFLLFDWVQATFLTNSKK